MTLDEARAFLKDNPGGFIDLPADLRAELMGEKPAELMLDLGCGPNKKEGHVGVDRIAFPGVDHILDVGHQTLPYADSTVKSIWTSHTVEHLTPPERCWMLNEAWRVLVPRGQLVMTVPHWRTSRAYGDPTHQWPPIGEFWHFYLNREWRLTQAPHTDERWWRQGYACDFETLSGYSFNRGDPYIAGRSDAALEQLAAHQCEVIMDMQTTMTAVKPRRGD